MTLPLDSARTDRHDTIDRAFRAFVGTPNFPCLAGKGILHANSYTLGVFGALGSERASSALADELSHFVRHLPADGAGLRAFVAVFPEKVFSDEIAFERALWRQLQLLHAHDALG